MNRIKNLLIIFFLVSVSFYFIGKTKVFQSFNNVFVPKPVFIDNTPILVKEIRSIGELITYHSIDEVVADTIIVTKGSISANILNKALPIPIFPTAEKKLVLICKGQVYAGTILTKLKDTDLIISTDTIRMYLPESEILDVIMNPADIEIFIEKGKWNDVEISAVKEKAKRKILARAINQQILQKANDQSIKVMKMYLKSFGYSNIFVSIK